MTLRSGAHRFWAITVAVLVIALSTLLAATPAEAAPTPGQVGAISGYRERIRTSDPALFVRYFGTVVTNPLSTADGVGAFQQFGGINGGSYIITRTGPAGQLPTFSIRAPILSGWLNLGAETTNGIGYPFTDERAVVNSDRLAGCQATDRVQSFRRLNESSGFRRACLNPATGAVRWRLTLSP